MIGLITAVFGGRPGLISGAAGAVAVIFVTLISDGHTRGMLFDQPVENMGFFYLMACVILMGIIQILAGVFKLGKVCSINTTPSNDGLCKWIVNCNFYCSSKNVYS